MTEIELRQACERLARENPDRFQFVGGNYLYEIINGSPRFALTVRSKTASEKLEKILSGLKGKP